ncbi:MAG: Ribulose-phosphate 3-epimerase [Parcubacteria group bacterium GW2011_GWA2_40_37]|nr:MAG: Ribulose-phosphate 3-epimerase [Parcubacteria group bacterium GW2011_GWA2_40_37]
MKPKIIIPSIFNFDLKIITKDIEKILSNKEAKMIHFDGLSGLAELKILMAKYKSTADVHSLTDRPLEDLKKIIKMNTDLSIRISMHLETETDIHEFIDMARQNKISPGLAIKLSTPITQKFKLYSGFDYFHLICNDELSNLNTFQYSVLDKVIALRAIIPNAKITLDCGIKEEHIIPSIETGVNNLIMGSAIFKSADPFDTIKKFNQIIYQNL